MINIPRDRDTYTMISTNTIRKGLGYFGTQLHRAVRGQPQYIGRSVNILYYQLVNYFSMYNRDGIQVLEEDWDNLIILDACRWDMFQNISDISGELCSKTTRGSSTTEFLQANFTNERLHDTVYVTANPQFNHNKDRINCQFHSVQNVWADDGWDDSEGTVLPETMVEATKTCAKKYPQKRIISHFVQPHFPFIDSEIGQGKFEHGNAELNIWEELMNGDVELSRESIWKAYNRNLQKALPAVRELLKSLEGKTVVTSDHGNMIGERASPIPIKEWGHPRGLYTDELVTIPWLVSSQGERKDTVSEAPSQQYESEEDDVQDRLADLGYL